MRTTIRLDEELLTEAKRQAVETGQTLTSLFEEALREALARRESSGKAKAVRLKTFKGDGLRPGIDLDDSASLADAMDA
jgi:Arc/MetJ family transcription regulator